MRVIFSRKGFDGTFGGCPSPIVDGRPVPLPIPTAQPSAITYGQLEGDYAAMVTDLTRFRHRAGTACHLDPDIDRSCLPRREGWRGAFGQIGAALGHLENQGVGAGDLFLFWGCYRPAEKRLGTWTFTGPTVHMLYGWLQVGRYHRLGPDGSHVLSHRPWLADHPHARPGWGNRNGLFVAADTVRVPGFRLERPGWGVLGRGVQLSAPGQMPSTWRVPDWLHPERGGVGMTYHPPHRWSANGAVRCAPRGQEFVAHVGDDVRVGTWLSAIMDQRLTPTLLPERLALPPTSGGGRRRQA